MLKQSLVEKENHLQESLRRQSEMEKKLYNINLIEYQQKQENERLLKVGISFCRDFLLIIVLLYSICKGKSLARRKIK